LLLRGNEQDVVAPHKAVPVLGLELPINVFFRLFHGNVHVAIETNQDAAVFCPRVELDPNGSAQHGFEKVGRRPLAVAGSGVGVAARGTGGDLLWYRRGVMISEDKLDSTVLHRGGSMFKGKYVPAWHRQLLVPAWSTT
jgi:hypothetical protein